MQRLGDTGVQSAWDRVLKLQTELLGPSELSWLRHHQALDHDVLEVGSGMGHYGVFLANEHKEQFFWGLEASQAFIDKCRGFPENYKVEQCRVGDDPFPNSLRGKCKTCLIRFVLQHSPDPLKLLSSLYKVLPTGAKVFIIEEDDRLFVSHGDFPAWNKAVALWRHACGITKTNSKMGLELPAVVERAGFVVEDFSIELRNNVKDSKAFFELFEAVLVMFQETLPSVVTNEELLPILAALRGAPPPNFVATYPQVLLVAAKRSGLEA
ncbi:methyltransferase domain-containing protein [Pseudomonas urmiensis]|uniref:methyltransferase domain-containing protein n=1 Tax=Pseudomonas urmiensis TaxID=2745493 RepID=UPI0034D61B37